MFGFFSEYVFFDTSLELWAAAVSIWFFFPSSSKLLSQCSHPLLCSFPVPRLCQAVWGSWHSPPTLFPINFTSESEGSCEGLCGSIVEEVGRAGRPLRAAPLHHLPRALGSFSRSQIHCSSSSTRCP